MVMPKNWDSMMLVARNDIWVNMKQIKGNVSDTEQVIWGGALQHYKDVHTHISKPHISSSMTESEKRSARAEYDRKVTIRDSNGAVLGLIRGISDYDELCNDNILWNLVTDADNYYSNECQAF